MSDEAIIPGIWPQYEAFYVEAMLFSTTASLMSADVLANIVTAVDSGEITDLGDLDQHAILDAVQNVVTHAAMLSRFFWPMKKSPEHLKRAEHLKTKLLVSDGNPLQNRDLRNYLEHFDERLDIYLQSGIVGHIIPAYFGRSVEVTSDIPLHIFRAFYIDKGIFKTLNHSYEIQPIVDEIGRLHELLTAASRNGCFNPETKYKEF